MTTQTTLPHLISLCIKKRVRSAYRTPPDEQALHIQKGKTEGDVKQTSHVCDKMETRLYVLAIQFFSMVWLQKQNNFQSNQQN